MYTWIEAKQMSHYPTVVDANTTREINVTIVTRFDVKTLYNWNSGITNHFKLAKFFGGIQVLFDAMQ